ncbi:uncharacterized protein BKCO1_5200073 [Diplodia corticola]|uniref:Uncharacterized protein n=1 Tax=Diplodia corticola TaxID=236234 RepID=A0A1J9RF11_9PEZI|nr:uncharacterized protein BKCO1_5200073 [Diplodia corticola]OJD31147.1 hypothetical protein BKCO1_5200073 [Diplodia corticola]
MKETMRSTLRNHERQTRQQSRPREPFTNTTPSAAQPSTPSSSSFGSRSPCSSPATAATVHRKPVKSSGNSSCHDAPVQEKARREKKGLVTMYRDAPPSDGEMLGAVVKEGWKGWQEKRRKEAARERPDLKGGEHEKGRQPRQPPAAAFASSSRPSSRPATRHGGASTHGYTKHTAHEHDSTKPDDLDVLVSKVADKLSHWSKGVSERSAEAKEKRMEERQRKEREALKKTISSPRPAETSSGRPSFGSDGSVRPLMGADKTGGSMAERMANRGGSDFEIPFWPRPRGKKDNSTASSATGSPQHRSRHGDGCDEGVTRVGDSIESELGSAPWNQHVTKSSPFSSPHSSRSSSDKQRSESGSGSPSGRLFGRFVPSPTTLFGGGGQSHPPRPPRRGSDDSFFGCQGISVEEAKAAQHLVQQDEHGEGHIKRLDLRTPPTGGHRRRDGGGGAEDGDDGRKRAALVTNDGAGRVSPVVRNAQHRPLVSDQGVDRRSVAAELVGQRQRRNGGDDDARGPGCDDRGVSWWDPPAQSSDGRRRAGTREAREGRGEAGTECTKYWTGYREKLRASGWEDGKPF